MKKIKMTMYEAFIRHFNLLGIREDEICFVGGCYVGCVLCDFEEYSDFNEHSSLPIGEFKKNVEGITIEGESLEEIDQNLSNLMKLMLIEHVENEEFACYFWQEEVGVRLQQSDIGEFVPRQPIKVDK